MLASYAISGGAGIHVFASNPGAVVIYTAGTTVTLTGTPVFSSEFALAQFFGFINIAGQTFSGSATGTRFSATVNGLINTNSAGLTYLPGSVAGSSATQGQYI